MNQARPAPKFAPAGFFVLRTPLLPFNEFLNWSDGLEAIPALDHPERLEQAYAADCQQLRKRLHRVVTRPEVRDALFVASPNIIERFHLWSDDPDGERGRKIEHVLVRYFSRMTGRATPFGLLAGISTGVIGDQTNLVVAERGRYRRQTRLDMDYLYALTDAITHDSALRKNLIFRPNNSLYRAGDRLHYVESRLNESERSYHLVALEETEYLAATLERAVSGATSETLAVALANDEVSQEDAQEYVAQLIEGQILVPDIGLNVSGPGAVHPLIEQLPQAKETEEIAVALQSTEEELEQIDRGGPGADLERYHFIAHSLERLPAKVELSRLFHVDLVKPAPTAMLGGAVLEEIERGITITHSLSPRRRETELTRFREAFLKRYEEKEVPLVKALDEEIGVGFGDCKESSPLLQDLNLPTMPEEGTIETERQAFNLRKLCEALSSGAREININKAEIEQFALGKPAPLPDSFAFQASVAARTPQALAAGDFRVLIGSGGGPSAAILMGRFCHADGQLKKGVMTILRQEEAQQPEAIFAEIVHLPGRYATIASRPQLRDYEIPFLARSVVDRDHQIPVTELFVSIRDDRVRLRCARSGREVIPRLTSAHNYERRSPALYRFLCLLQNQDTAWLPTWDWGDLSTAPFLPRVSSGRLVLSRARWYVRKEEFRPLVIEKGAARFRAVQSWRKERGLPRFITVADHDNRLPVDLDNVLSVESFVQLVRERQATQLVELFPTPDELCASGPEGSFVHELIVPFVSEPQAPANGLSARGKILKETGKNSLPSPVLTRRFPPGSEWLYVKLYTGTALTDRILRELVAPLVKDVKSAGDVDCWFFIRYSDPDFHLRLRFHGDPGRLRDRLQPLLKDVLAPMVADNRIWRVQFDTYEREVERYGGAERIVLSEQLFQADSEAALALIEMLGPGEEGADERWRLALYGIDRLLDDFRFDVDKKHFILKRMRDAFAEEFGVDQDLRKQLSDKFRKERKALRTLLDAAPDSDHPLVPGLAALQDRSAKLSGIADELRSSERKNRLSLPLTGLMPHYIHMHANRLLRSAQRQQELVIYDLLTKLYESELKRFGQSQSKRKSTLR